MISVDPDRFKDTRTKEEWTFDFEVESATIIDENIPHTYHLMRTLSSSHSTCNQWHVHLF